MHRPKVLVLTGPTASGKTEAAIAVAKCHDAVVLSADAMQVYRGLDIGTAKASPEEQAAVPHHAIDVVDPHESFDAADFVRLGDGLLSEGLRVVVAGGTSLYVQAFVRGLVPTPPVDAALRERLEEETDPHGRLSEVDPVLAERLHPNDRVRIIRGLEVFHASGQRLSDLQAEHARAPDRLEATGLWLDRENLRERIDGRLEIMMGAGYVAEVEGLLAAGVHRGLKPMRSLGYRHLCGHLLDGLDLEEALWRTRRDTWRFARKQRNWMRILGYERVEHDHVQRALVAAEQVFAD